MPLSADEIASCALYHYEKCISRGKPKPDAEWTVYAAVVAERTATTTTKKQSWVVSCATGTKCTAQRVQGSVLHDCHAEVLARRGLLRCLWMEVMATTKVPQEHSNDHEPNSLLEGSTDTSKKLVLRADTILHLYVSCSPCGDATIYPVTGDQVMLHTGAKVIVSQETGVDATICGGNDRLLEGTTVAREAIQYVGKLRTKAGRSNLPAHLRSTSMSCSDKLVQWSVLGLQGGMLSGILARPIMLSSIVVSMDPRASRQGSSSAQLKALERAIPSRIQSICKEINSEDARAWNIQLPTVHIVTKVFLSDKSTMECSMRSTNNSDNNSMAEDTGPVVNIRKRKRGGTTLSPCGISLNWQSHHPTSTEMVVGARGIRQGKKPKSDKDYPDLASRLSRREISRLCTAIDKHNTDETKSSGRPTTYQELKRTVADHKWLEFKSKVLKSGVLAGWLRGGNGADFSLTGSVKEKDAR